MSFPHFAHPAVRIATACCPPPPVVNVSTLGDVNALAFALGGNSLIAGFYDRRLNVTLSTLNVTAWADCRSSGGGPTANYFGSGTNPTVTVAGSPIAFTAGGATLGAAASGAFVGPFPLATVFVGSAPAATTATLCGVINGQPRKVDVSTSSTSGGEWKGVVGNSAGSQLFSSLAPDGSTVRVVITDLDATGTIGRLTVPNQATVTTSGVTSTHNFTANLFMGSDINGATTATACIVSAILVLNVVPTTGQISSILNWAVTNHSAVGQ